MRGGDVEGCPEDWNSEHRDVVECSDETSLRNTVRFAGVAPDDGIVYALSRQLCSCARPISTTGAGREGGAEAEAADAHGGVRAHASCPSTCHADVNFCIAISYVKLPEPGGGSTVT